MIIGKPSLDHYCHDIYPSNLYLSWTQSIFADDGDVGVLSDVFIGGGMEHHAPQIYDIIRKSIRGRSKIGRYAVFRELVVFSSISLSNVQDTSPANGNCLC